jgi:hypothetical protein
MLLCVYMIPKHMPRTLSPVMQVPGLLLLSCCTGAWRGCGQPGAGSAGLLAAKAFGCQNQRAVRRRGSRNLFGRLRIPVAFRRTVPVRIRFFRRYARRLYYLMQCADLHCVMSCCLSRFLPFAELCMLPNC